MNLLNMLHYNVTELFSVLRDLDLGTSQFKSFT